MRDRYSLLTKKAQIKLKSEENASGIDTNNSELDDLLKDILEKEKSLKESSTMMMEIKRSHSRKKRLQRRIWKGKSAVCRDSAKGAGIGKYVTEGNGKERAVRETAGVLLF